jgi:hypothetical protein
MTKMRTSRRDRADGPFVCVVSLTSELPDSGSRGHLSSPLPDSGTPALRHHRTLSVRHSATHELTH